MVTDKRFLRRMKIPLLYWDCTWEEIPDDLDYKKTVQSFAHDIKKHCKEGTGLFMFGPNSTGKTALGTMLLRSLPKGKRGLFVVAEKIPGYIIEKTLYDVDETYEDRMRNVDLLVLDEIILHNSDTFRDTCVESLLRDRVMDCKSTILTSNLMKEEIETNYSSLYQVMLECVYPIKITGKNFRDARKRKV